MHKKKQQNKKKHINNPKALINIPWECILFL